MTTKWGSRHRHRHQVAGRGAGWICAFCGARVQCPTCFPETSRPATTDHITPRAKGGSNNLRNLQIACLPCNRDKADRKHPQNTRTAS